MFKRILKRIARLKFVRTGGTTAGAVEQRQQHTRTPTEHSSNIQKRSVVREEERERVRESFRREFRRRARDAAATQQSPSGRPQTNRLLLAIGKFSFDNRKKIMNLDRILGDVYGADFSAPGLRDDIIR